MIDVIDQSPNKWADRGSKQPQRRQCAHDNSDAMQSEDITHQCCCRCIQTPIEKTENGGKEILKNDGPALTQPAARVCELDPCARSLPSQNRRLVRLPGRRKPL